MRPRLIALIAAAVVAELALVAGLGLLISPQFRGPQHAQVGVERGFNVAVPEPAFGNVLEGPFAPGELKGLRGGVVEARDCTVSGPYTHGNLSVFLIHGRDTLGDRKLVTLQEALGRGQAVVRETGSMTLAIENRSDADLFLQSGDIVKGGTQDRVIRYDQVVPAGTAGAPLAVFCVEQGRCGPRGVEPRALFSSATERLPNRQLRLASLYRKSQADVWSGVSQTQADLNRNVG